MCLKTKVTTSICRHHLIQTQAWRLPIYMHRHNDYDDVKDNADGDAVVNDLDDRDFFCVGPSRGNLYATEWTGFSQI